WEALCRGFAGLLALGDVLDVGAGDGAVAELLAPFAKSVTLVDRSEKLVEAARARLGRFSHVACGAGDTHELGFADASFDQALLSHVLSYSPDPARAIAEASRVLRPGGKLALATLEAHGHGELTAAYGHVGAGFRAPFLREALERAGLRVGS